MPLYLPYFCRIFGVFSHTKVTLKPHFSYSVMSSPQLLTASPPKYVTLTRIAAVGSLLGLIVLGLLWELWLAPLRPGGSFLVLKVLPLCIPLAGLLKNRMFTYRWVSLFVWLYFIEGVVRAWGDKAPSNYLAMIEVVLCVILFTACALHVRQRLLAAKAAQAMAAALGAHTDIHKDALS
jgi:uncharacterized membrane protein